MTSWVVAQLHRLLFFFAFLCWLGSGSKTIDYKIPPMGLFFSFLFLVVHFGVAEALQRQMKWLGIYIALLLSGGGADSMMIMTT
ncbi:hypothetical protein BDP81DRAFT_425229 [Colletotrichum phormii]|uniref:Uncharacterized protein n=1 Tax=Colletotrichum phormii TaxID=359342 RepID=A0AAI9ZVE4_9PEZI|nr:uncharacterized protein BDP81DRAFT_425229 [Colletotrichum phormii]KAK1638571.1 hypothetical protein BDP81DRAFT_425229 [Colletotrichum phormii]